MMINTIPVCKVFMIFKNSNTDSFIPVCDIFVLTMAAAHLLHRQIKG